MRGHLFGRAKDTLLTSSSDALFAVADGGTAGEREPAAGFTRPLSETVVRPRIPNRGASPDTSRIPRYVDEMASDQVLSGREVQVLNWVRNGKTNQEIAMILDISPLTVKNHMQKILRKLNVSNRAQAVAKAIAARIMSDRELA